MHSLLAAIASIAAAFLALAAWILLMCLLRKRPVDKEINFQDLDNIQREEEELSRKMDD